LLGRPRLRNNHGNCRLIIKITDVRPVEEDLSDRVRDRMKTRNQTIPFLRNDEQKVVANGYPDLRVNGVLGGSVEGLDVQMRLDPFEEQFNLPPLAVQFRNGERVFNREVVGQKAIDLPGVKVLIHNKSHRIGILPGGVVARKTNRLIRKDSGTSVDRSGLKNLVDHIVFCSGDKEGALLLEVFEKLLKSDISLVHQLESTGLYRDFVHHLSIIDLAGCEENKGGNRASQVHQRMHLEGAFPVMELRPGAQLQTELNRAAVERIYHLFKTNPQLFILVKRGGFFYQSHRKVLIDTLILLLVGFRKRGFGHHLDASPIPIATEVKCSLNISQTSSVGELSKAHHHELVTAIELDRVTVAFIAVNTLLELVFVEERHDMSEDCFSFVHGLRMAS